MHVHRGFKRPFEIHSNSGRQNFVIPDRCGYLIWKCKQVWLT